MRILQRALDEAPARVEPAPGFCDEATFARILRWSAAVVKAETARGG